MGNACARGEETQVTTPVPADGPDAKGASYAAPHDRQQAVRGLPDVHKGRSIQALCNCGDGSLLSGGDDKEVALTDWVDGRELYRWKGHTGTVNRLAFSPASRLAFSGARDQLIHAWRVGEPRPVLKLEGHSLTVTGLDLSDAEGLIASGSRDYTVRLWDIATGVERDVRKYSRNVVTFIRWCSGEPSFIQASEDLQLRLWDARAMQVTQSFTGHVNILQCCDASSDGNYLLSCSNGFDGEGCETFLWDRRKGALLRRFVGHMQAVNCCSFLDGRKQGPADSGSRLLFATGSTDQTVRVWPADGTGDTLGECLALAEAGAGGLTAAPVTAMARLSVGDRASPEVGRFRDMVAAGNFSGGIRVWGVHATGGGGGKRAAGRAEEGDIHLLRRTESSA